MRRSSQDSNAVVARVVGAALLVAMSTLENCASIPGKTEPVLLRRAQMHMGTLVTITATARTEAVAQAAMTAGFQEIRRLEELLSTLVQESGLSREDQGAGRETVDVGPGSIMVL